MGFFDWYEPRPDLHCPRCDSILQDWQGKDGPCGLFVWRQGEPHPVDQRVDSDVQLPAEKLLSLHLPPQFIIYTECNCSRTLVEVICTAEDGVWTTARLARAEDVDTIHYDMPKAWRSERKRNV